MFDSLIEYSESGIFVFLLFLFFNIFWFMIEYMFKDFGIGFVLGLIRINVMFFYIIVGS